MIRNAARWASVQRVFGVPVPPSMWYDFSDASSLTVSSGRIDQVNDKGGGGKHLIATGTARPFTGRNVNGLAVADFQAAQHLRYDSPGSNFGFDTTNYTYFVAGLVDDGSPADSGILSIHDTGSNSDWNNPSAFIFSNGTASHLWNHLQNTIGITELGGTKVAPGVWGYRKISGSAQRARVPYGSGLITSSIITSSGVANGGIILGGRYLAGNTPTSQTWDGTIGEVLVYNYALSDSEMDAVYEYLTAKWGSHPTSLPITSGLWGHWNPNSDSDIVLSSDRIDQVNDLSGNGRHLVATGTNRPYADRLVLGRRVMDFRLGQYIRAAHSIDTQNYTLFYVLGDDRGNASNAGILSLCNTGQMDWDNANSLTLAVVPSSGGHSAVYTANGSNVMFINMPAIGTPIASGYRHNNGGTDAQYPTGAEGARNYGGTAAQGLIIGTRWSSGPATPYWDGFVGECIVYDTPLSNAEMITVGDWLTWNWQYA